VVQKISILFFVDFFYIVFVTQEGMAHILRFYLWYTVIAPVAPQETVGEAGIEPKSTALQFGVTRLT
jgi:hypothetical protein